MTGTRLASWRCSRGAAARCATILVSSCALACSDPSHPKLGSTADFVQDGAPLSLAAGEADDYFGFSIALSGTTALVGAPRRGVGDNREQGAAYVFVRNGGSWQAQGPALIADDGALGDHFGLSVALAGDTAVIGAPGHAVGQSPFRGAAYVFVRNGEIWSQQGAELSADDGEAADAFGTAVAVAVHEDTANLIVGAPYHDVDGHSDQGAAYAFTRSGQDWVQRGGALTAGNGLAGEVFGSAVAVSGNTALVGAPVHQVGVNPYQGGVYVFVDDGVAWAQQGPELIADDGGPFDQLSSCALVADLALVGAPLHVVGADPMRGAAYLFSRTGDTWSQRARLIADDGAASDEFGSQVALSADAALIAAPGRGAPASSYGGGVYAFAPDAQGLWTQHGTMLSVSGGAPTEVFGSALALAEGSALIGAPFHKVGDNAAQGAVYALLARGLATNVQSR